MAASLKWYTLFALLFSLYSSFAQPFSCVAIRILDAERRDPLAGVSVSCKSKDGGWSSDTSGRCCIPVDKTGQSLRLQFRLPGYETYETLLKHKAEEQTVYLQTAENHLGTVVVSATMKEVIKDVSPIPVEIYTPRFFQKNPSASIFEALGAVNGVRPQINCNVCNTGDIHINGMEGPYTMIAIDGMPIVSGLSTVYGLSGIPNGMVERIEIVKGPASTLYGSEAVAGLINVITKNARSAPRFYVDAYALHNGEFNVDAALKFQKGVASSLLGINGFSFGNRMDINGDNFTDISLQRRVSIFNKWHFERKKGRIATLAGRFVHENRWGGELQWEEKWRGTDSIYGESIYTNRAEFIARYQLPIASRKLIFDLSWNTHHQDSYYGTTPYLGLQQVFFGQLHSDLPLGKKHDALIGTALRKTFYDDNTPATTSPDGARNLPSRSWLPGVFFQDDIAFNPRHLLSLGLRYDRHNAHGNILTPRLSWKWTHDPQHILRLTLGSGYRVANIFTEDHAALSGAREVVIAESLDPERSWNVNLNYNRKLYPSGMGFIGLDASLFLTRFSNQIIPDYDSNPQQIIFSNLDGYAISRGLSLNADLNFMEGAKWMAGFTLMDVFQQENGLRRAMLFAPPFALNSVLSWPLPLWRISLDYTANLNSPMALPTVPGDYRPTHSPWFSIHNLQITWKKSGLEIYAGVKNLFGFFPREDVILRAFDPFDKYTDVNNPQGFTFDPTYNYAPIQRQRVLLGVRWRVY